MSDVNALKHAGRLGHRFAVIAGEPRRRRILGECSSLAVAARWIRERHPVDPACYEFVGGHWLTVPVPRGAVLRAGV